MGGLQPGALSQPDADVRLSGREGLPARQALPILDERCGS